MSRFGSLLMLILGSLVLMTCARITVNVYFPAAEIRSAAEEIESEVRQGEEPPEDTTPPTPSSNQGSSGLWPSSWHVRLAWGPPPALAQNVNIKISTPAIRRLVNSRKRRFASLVPLLNKGALGENNRGLLGVRAVAGLSLKDKGRANSLSRQENRDRQQLYSEVAKANNLSSGQVGEIGKIFAAVNRKQARRGWWIQEASGAWRQK